MFILIWLAAPYHDLVGGFAERWQDCDGIDGDGPGLFRAIVLALNPAVVLREIIVFNEHDELSFLEAEERGVFWRGLKNNWEVSQLIIRRNDFKGRGSGALTLLLDFFQGHGVLRTLRQPTDKHGNQLGHVRRWGAAQGEVSFQRHQRHGLARFFNIPENHTEPKTRLKHSSFSKFNKLLKKQIVYGTIFWKYPIFPSRLQLQKDKIFLPYNKYSRLWFKAKKTLK